jgi:Cu+-exporting ATPase
MAIDPICGMTVDETKARSAERDGQTFYFCSEHCRKKFLAADEHAAPRHDHSHHGPQNDHATTKPSAAKYICPMCEGVESAKPGNCPKCGMAL